MKRITTQLMLLGMLAAMTACGPTVLERKTLMPAKVTYDRIDEHAFLKHKISVGEFHTNISEEIDYSNFSKALRSSLRRAKLLSTAKPTYELSGKILDVSRPECFSGICENGAAIQYELTHIREQRTVWTETIIVPYSASYMLFIDGMDGVMTRCYAGAISENISHLIQVLGQKTATDLH